jgi:hypothetical protein
MSNTHEVLSNNHQLVLDEIGEMFVALQNGQMPNLDRESLERINLAADVLKIAVAMTVEYSEGMRANSAAISSISIVAPEDFDDSSVTGVGDTPSESNVAVADRTKDDAEAAAVVSSLILGDAVVVDEISDNVHDVVESAAPEQEQLGLNDEAWFILSELRKIGEIKTVTKADLNAMGFESVKDRASAAAYQTCFAQATKALRAKGLMVCPVKGEYQLTERALETFLAK